MYFAVLHRIVQKCCSVQKGYFTEFHGLQHPFSLGQICCCQIESIILIEFHNSEALAEAVRCMIVSTFLAAHYCLFWREVLTFRMCWIRGLVENEPLQYTVHLKLEDVLVLLCPVAIELICLMYWVLIKTKQCQAGFNFCMVSPYLYRTQTNKTTNTVSSCAYILNETSLSTKV